MHASSFSAPRPARPLFLIGIVFILLSLQVATILPGIHPAARAQERPNILLILTDDQRFDTMGYIPRIKAHIFDQGLTFSNAFVTTSLCCPSRASILTGMLARDHDVHVNEDPYTPATLARHLRDAGFYTGYIGKYLNSWGGGGGNRPLPEYDYWVGANGSTVFGTQQRYAGYHTYLYRDYALDFLRQSANRDQPFFLTLATNAPHTPADPAPGDETLYPNLPLHRPPSFNEADITDKPSWLASNAPLTSQEIADIGAFRRKQLQSLNAVDIAIEDVLNLLSSQGRLDNTVILFVSDNGMFWGEHRFDSWHVGKNEAYEEAIHVPFAIRYPHLISSPRIESRLVANIDIAPTLYELAGLSIPAGVAGRSLVPLMTGTTNWRTELLLEGWPWSWQGQSYGRTGPYRGVRTERYVLVDHQNDLDELYDLQSDPYQLQNQIGNAAYDGIQADLESRLARLTTDPSVIDSAEPSVTYGTWRGVKYSMWNSVGASYRASGKASHPIQYTTPYPTTAVTLITYRGPNQGMGQVAIDGVVQGTLDLYASSPQNRYTKTYSNLPMQVHSVTVTVLGQKNPSSRGTEVRIDAFIAGATVHGATSDDHTTDVQYGCWAGVTRSEAYGGSYRAANCADAELTVQVTGNAFTWLTARGPDAGQAMIYVDGVAKGTVDLYHPTPQWQHRHVISGLSTGTHTVRIRVLSTRNPSSTGTVVIFDGIALTGAVATLPGRIEAEDYRWGREGVGYHDTTPSNMGGAGRLDDVDIQPTSDVGGGFNVGWIAAGEWLSFDARVAGAGQYEIRVRVASPNAGKSFHVEVDGKDVTGSVSVPRTGGWQTWATVPAGTVDLTAGYHTLRFVGDIGTFNVNYIEVIQQ